MNEWKRKGITLQELISRLSSQGLVAVPFHRICVAVVIELAVKD